MRTSVKKERKHFELLLKRKKTPTMEGHHIGDAFFVRAMCGNDYAFFGDLWVNVRLLKVYRGGVYRADINKSFCSKNVPFLFDDGEQELASQTRRISRTNL